MFTYNAYYEGKVVSVIGCSGYDARQSAIRSLNVPVNKVGLLALSMTGKILNNGSVVPIPPRTASL